MYFYVKINFRNIDLKIQAKDGQIYQNKKYAFTSCDNFCHWNEHTQKKLWESKQVYHLDDWGRKRDDQLPHHQAHTYIHYITYYVFTMYLPCIYYVLCTIFISSLHSRLHLLVNQSNMYYRDDDALCRIFWERHFTVLDGII